MTSVNILLNSSLPNIFNSTLTGNLPYNSGNISSGFDILNAPAHINSICLVLIFPWLKFIVVPSIKGNKSLYTPSVEGDLLELGSFVYAILSISSINTIPDSSTSLIAFLSKLNFCVKLS